MSRNRSRRKSEKQLLQKLIAAEQFERFLHTKYLGQKRFLSSKAAKQLFLSWISLMENAGARGVEDIGLGMAHRGRLNVLANVVGQLLQNESSQPLKAPYIRTSLQTKATSSITKAQLASARPAPVAKLQSLFRPTRAIWNLLIR
ncbi:MAG: hypothetical protein WKF84_26490 [Pyrinomonadaceae bacterium]